MKTLNDFLPEITEKQKREIYEKGKLGCNLFRKVVNNELSTIYETFSFEFFDQSIKDVILAEQKEKQLTKQEYEKYIRLADIGFVLGAIDQLEGVVNKLKNITEPLKHKKNV